MTHPVGWKLIWSLVNWGIEGTCHWHALLWYFHGVLLVETPSTYKHISLYECIQIESFIDIISKLITKRFMSVKWKTSFHQIRYRSEFFDHCTYNTSLIKFKPHPLNYSAEMITAGEIIYTDVYMCKHGYTAYFVRSYKVQIYLPHDMPAVPTKSTKYCLICGNDFIWPAFLMVP